VELLKQKRFSPLSVQQQIVLIFAGLQGYLDEVPMEKIPTVKQRLITLAAEGSKYINFDVTQKAPLTELKKFVEQNI